MTDVTWMSPSASDVKHGFAVDDTPVYDRQASELHWQRILRLFAEQLL